MANRMTHLVELSRSEYDGLLERVAELRERIRLRLVALPDGSDESKWLSVTLADLDMAFPSHHAINKNFERIELK